MESLELWTAARRELALAEAESWRGTPHAHRIAARGRGIDCIRYVVRIMVAGGVVEESVLPTYPTAWGMGAQESKLGRAFLQCADATAFPVEEWVPEFGDVCIWKVGRNSNHCGIFLDGRVWHVSTHSPAGPLELKTARRNMQEAIRLNRCGWTLAPDKLRLLTV